MGGVDELDCIVLFYALTRASCNIQ